MSFSEDPAATGRWAAGEEPAVKPYEPPSLTVHPMKLVTPAELERGYETVNAEGLTERGDYVILAYVVVDPDRSPRDGGPAGTVESHTRSGRPTAGG